MSDTGVTRVLVTYVTPCGQLWV